MKETVHSVQASLITSVSLIQGIITSCLGYQDCSLNIDISSLCRFPPITLIKIRMKDKSFVYSLILSAHNFQTLESRR